MKTHSGPCCRYSFLLALLVSTVVTASQTAPNQAPDMQQVLYAPIAGIAEFEEWDLVVVNHNPPNIPVKITVYSFDGKPYPSTIVTLDGEQTTHFNIRTLVSWDNSQRT